ncbi:MAG: encapsulin [Egibacteraceae bacterium]
MPIEAPGLPWTDEQWATAQRTVLEAARKARVASSFLPLFGPLPSGQATVPALNMESTEIVQGQRGEAPKRLEIDDGKTFRLTTIACDVYLRTQEAEDPDLGAARQMLARAADVIGRLEDAIVFNGLEKMRDSHELRIRGSVKILPEIYTIRNGEQSDGLSHVGTPIPVQGRKALVSAVVEAIQTLEGTGYYGPFACVLGDELYLAANTPNKNSLVLPSDRITPFLEGGPLRRSGVVPAPQGVVVALSGSPIDLVVASDVHVEYVQLTIEPRYVLRVSERFVLRIKQPGAVCRLEADSAASAEQDRDEALANTNG